MGCITLANRYIAFTYFTYLLYGVLSSWRRVPAAWAGCRWHVVGRHSLQLAATSEWHVSGSRPLTTGRTRCQNSRRHRHWGMWLAEPSPSCPHGSPRGLPAPGTRSPSSCTTNPPQIHVTEFENHKYKCMYQPSQMDPLSCIVLINEVDAQCDKVHGQASRSNVNCCTYC